MSIGLATVIVSLVIVAAQGLGAIVNDRRYVNVKLEIFKSLGDLRERIVRLETLVRNGSGQS